MDSLSRIVLPGTDIRTSRLGYGTASLHNIVSRRARESMLAKAFDLGFIHFDTAPYYGHGLAEDSLGQFCRGRRDKVVIASKIGILASPLLRHNHYLMYASKAAGALATKLGFDRRAPRRFSLDPSGLKKRAEDSLQQTLRALRTDYLDLLLFHEPPAHLATLPDEIVLWLVDLKTSGLVRATGIAGEVEPVLAIANQCPAIADVLQVRDSVDAREADAIRATGRRVQITYGYFRSHATSVDSALARNPHGVTLIGTTNPTRLHTLARKAE